MRRLLQAEYALWKSSKGCILAMALSLSTYVIMALTFAAICPDYSRYTLWLLYLGAFVFLWSVFYWPDEGMRNGRYRVAASKLDRMSFLPIIKRDFFLLRFLILLLTIVVILFVVALMQLPFLATSVNSFLNECRECVSIVFFIFSVVGCAFLLLYDKRMLGYVSISGVFGGTIGMSTEFFEKFHSCRALGIGGIVIFFVFLVIFAIRYARLCALERKR